MKKFIVSAFAALFVLASCMKENLEPLSPEAGNLKEFTARFESNATRTTLDGYDVYWSKGDAIAVFAPDGTKAKFTIDEQSMNGASARFVGSIKDADEYVAVYPYSAADSYDGTRLSFTAPSAQTAVTGGFGNGSNIAVAAPSQKDLTFKNVTTLLKVNVKRSDVAKLVITTTGTVPVSGSYSVTPKVAQIETEAVGKTLTVAPTSGNLAPGLYYIPVPYTTDKLSDLTLSLQNSSGTELTGKTFDPGFMLYRNRICNLGDFGTGISCAQDLVDFAAAVNSGKSTTAWQSNGEVVLLNNINMSAVTNWTPIGNATITYGGYTTVSVADGYAFTGKFNGNGYSITNFAMKNTATNKPFGLFGLLSGATVKNVNLGTPSDNSILYSKASARTNVGALCGISWKSQIDNCDNYIPITIAGTSSSTMFSIGGIVGYMTSDGSAVYATKNCNNYGAIEVTCGTNAGTGSAGVQVGGISGFSASSTTATYNTLLENCANYGAINAKCGRVCGLTPVLMYSDAKNCTNYGAITSTLASSLNAGLVCFQTYAAVMTDCWNYGSVLMQGEKSYGAGMVANLNDQIASGTHKAQITGGGNRGTVVYAATPYNTNCSHQLVSIYTSGRFNKVDNVVAGGRVGYYDINGDIQFYNITSSNYMTYAIVAASNITNIIYEGASKGGISTLAEFQDFANLVNSGQSTWKYEDEEGYVNLLADIDMAGVSDWKPIGMPTAYVPDIYTPSYTGCSYKGKFNGNGHTIKNLKLSATNASGVFGLFGVVQGATIKNLVLGTGSDASEFEVSAVNAMDAGVLAGCVIDSKLNNITNNVPITIGGISAQEKFTVGAIAGFVGNTGEGKSELDGLKNYGDITGVSGGNSSNSFDGSVQIGGLVAFCSANIETDEINTLMNSDNYGSISVQGGRVGGINGTALFTEISKVVNYGDLTNTQVNARAAGISAIMGRQSSLINCVNEGDITTTQSSGESAGLTANIAHTSAVVTGGGNYGVITSRKTDNRGIVCARVIQLASISGVTVGGSLFCNGEEQELTKANYVSYSYNTSISSSNAAKITDLIYDGDNVGIRTAEELVEFATLVNEGKDYSKFVNESGGVVLLKDIDMSSVKNWVPIGYATLNQMTSAKAFTISSGNAFTGTFDGNAHVIKGLKMVAPAGETGIRPYGLFGVVNEGSVIQNFQFDENCSLTINSTNSCAVGMVAGMVLGSQIRDISVFGPTIFQAQATTPVYAGPLVGALWSSLTSGCIMDSCHNYGKITAYNLNNIKEAYALPPSPTSPTGYILGGLVGMADGVFGSSSNYKTNMLSDSSNKGDIETALYRTGGIIGTLSRQTTASNCINSGNIHATAAAGAHIGGITAVLFSYCNMIGCRNMGNIICTNRAFVGGLVASVPSGGRKMSLCSNYGIILSDSDFRGVFWAYNGKESARIITYENCIAAGKLGEYTGGSYTYDEYDESNQAKYLGYDYKVETMKLTDLVYKIGVTSPSGGSSAGLKILCIGNSFTQDAMWQVPNILSGFGIKDVMLCQMYYGGRVLEAYNNGWSSSSDYTAYIYYAGSTEQTVKSNQNLAVMAASEEWDMVTLMEHTGSYHSWFWTATEKAAIQGLIDKVKKTQAGVPKFYYIMSQSYWDMSRIPNASKKYAPGGEEELFANRQGQHAVTCTQAQKVMAEITDFEDIVATGTALENLRTTSVCEDHALGLTRDGYHMDKGIARYCAGCVMYQVMLYPIYKKDLNTNTFRDATTSTTTDQLQTAITDTNAPIAQQAALHAVTDPYVITDMSSY